MKPVTVKVQVPVSKPTFGVFGTNAPCAASADTTRLSQIRQMVVPPWLTLLSGQPFVTIATPDGLTR